MSVKIGYSGQEYSAPESHGIFGVDSDYNVRFLGTALDFNCGNFDEAIVFPGLAGGVGYNLPIVSFLSLYYDNPRYLTSYSEYFPEKIITNPIYSGHYISGSEHQYVGERYYLFENDREYDFVIENSGVCSLYPLSNEVVGKASLFGDSVIPTGNINARIDFYEKSGSVVTGTQIVYLDYKRGSYVTPYAFSGGLMISGAYAQIKSRIDGKTFEVNSPLYSYQDAAAQIYTRNVNFWGTGLSGLNAISPWNKNNGPGLGVTLITPRHVIGCNHSLGALASGNIIRFVDDDNNVVNATSKGYKRLSNSYSGPYVNYVDLAVAALDRDITGEGIKPVRVAASGMFAYNDTGNYTGAYISGRGFPLMCLNKYEKGYIQGFEQISLDIGGCFLNTNQDTQPLYTVEFITGEVQAPNYDYYDEEVYCNIIPGWSSALVGGDSGNPVFVVIDDELVLVTVWFYTRSLTRDAGGGGSYIGHYIREINSAISEIDSSLGSVTNYEVTEFVPKRAYYSYPV